MSDSAAPQAEPQPVRFQIVQQGGRLAHPLPDAVLALLFALAALVEFLPPQSLLHVPTGLLASRDDLIFVLFVEGGFLLMQGSLIDVATRLKKQPPLWVAMLIVAGLALFSDHALEVLQVAWQRGMMVFLPLLISLGERGLVLWQMPKRTRIEKIAARALASNRITAGIAILGLCVAAIVAMVVVTDLPMAGWLPFAAGALYYGMATYDAYRVRGRKFAEKPTVLLRFDPIHIEYLEPL